MALLIIPVLKKWSRARGLYGYLRTWNWPITARKISQPYNNTAYYHSIYNSQSSQQEIVLRYRTAELCNWLRSSHRHQKLSTWNISKCIENKIVLKIFNFQFDKAISGCIWQDLHWGTAELLWKWWGWQVTQSGEAKTLFSIIFKQSGRAIALSTPPSPRSLLVQAYVERQQEKGVLKHVRETRNHLLIFCSISRYF